MNSVGSVENVRIRGIQSAEGVGDTCGLIQFARSGIYFNQFHTRFDFDFFLFQVGKSFGKVRVSALVVASSLFCHS